MADFSISQFKAGVAAFIKAAGIDDGNGVIEASKGEVKKLTAAFHIQESKIGDLLETNQNSSIEHIEVSLEKPTQGEVHENFIEAHKKYDSMTPEMQAEIREKTQKIATDKFEQLFEQLCKIEISIEPLYDLINYDNLTPELLHERVRSEVQKIIKDTVLKIGETIEKFSTAFSEYDPTYNIPCGGCTIQLSYLNPVNKLVEDFFENTHPEELTMSEYLQIAEKFLNELEALNPLEKMKADFEEQYNNYEEQFTTSMDALKNQAYITDESEPNNYSYLAMEGAPIENTFAQVINEYTTDISGVKADSPKNSQVYDLSGKAVTGELQSGQVYVQNGRKFVAQ